MKAIPIPKQLQYAALGVSIALAGCSSGQRPVQLPASGAIEGSPSYPDPTRYEEAIRAFEAADAARMPPEDAILFVGSSSIRFWHEALAEDMEPLEVIARGFGGSNMNDLIHYADRIVYPYLPRAVVVYEGDNDIASGLSPEQVYQSFQEFVRETKFRLPRVDIHFIAIKPSVARWALWPKMEEANELIRSFCERSRGLYFHDVATPMLGEDGKPRPELFVDDDLHLSRAGYEVWKDVLRPPLQELYGDSAASR